MNITTDPDSAFIAASSYCASFVFVESLRYTDFDGHATVRGRFPTVPTTVQHCFVSWVASLIGAAAEVIASRIRSSTLVSTESAISTLVMPTQPAIGFASLVGAGDYGSALTDVLEGPTYWSGVWATVILLMALAVMPLATAGPRLCRQKADDTAGVSAGVA
jgi:hypothetical protein